MPPAEQPRPSPIALTVLLMLMSGPLHPYEMQRRMKLWGKDLVVNLSQRATLYKTIERLLEAHLIEVVGTEREPGFPERTVYAVNTRGRTLGSVWLHDMLAIPRNEYPQFPAALSFIMALTPDEARRVLEARVELLTKHLERLDEALKNEDDPVAPAVALLDGDYVRAMTEAELNWLGDVLTQLRSGTLNWTEEELRESLRESIGD